MSTSWAKWGHLDMIDGMMTALICTHAALALLLAAAVARSVAKKAQRQLTQARS